MQAAEAREIQRFPGRLTGGVWANSEGCDDMSAAAEKLDQILITSEEDIHVASRSLKAMAHPLRLKILCLLGGSSEVSVQDIVDHVGTSQSNISQHLSILREKGILVARKDANKVYYRIGDPKILGLIGSLREAFCSVTPR
jgi:DNA-binding transcriptional ArsR family regulator